MGDAMKMHQKLLATSTLALGTAMLATPPSASWSSAQGYTPSYVSYSPGPNYYAWQNQSGHTAPGTDANRSGSRGHR
jgi:ABC-type oligopeptide transport system substrate-binding subunit